MQSTSSQHHLHSFEITRILVVQPSNCLYFRVESAKELCNRIIINLIRKLF
jgi:hypothetical protein